MDIVGGVLFVIDGKEKVKKPWETPILLDDVLAKTDYPNIWIIENFDS